jgi:N-methylhydantoinase B
MTVVDAITAQVIRESFESISAEMSLIVERTAVHPLFNEVHDFSTGVFHCGESVALVARATALPVHIFASLRSVEAMLEAFGDDLADGDVVLLNDPYMGGTHNADWTIMRPLFLADGTMICPAVRAHMADSGGPVPGNYNPDAREVWQEAFRLPPVKIAERGVPRHDVLRTISSNCRLPDVLEGDLGATLAACDVAVKRIEHLVQRYGESTITSSIGAALDYAERRLRAEVQTWPDGAYEGSMLLDHDAAGCEDIRVHTKIEVSGSDLRIDFAGTSPQSPGFINSPLANTAGWAYTALCSVLPEDIPINSGLFRVVEIDAPLGSVVNSVPPAPTMSTTGRIGGEIGTSTMKSLERIVPEACGAVAFGGSLSTVYGTDPRYDEFFVTIEYGSNLSAASGAFGTDGWGGWPTPHSTLVFSTIEMLELQFPFRYHRYEYTTDTAPAGRWRGLPAFAMEREAIGDQYINAIVVGVRNRAPGWAGGEPGIPNKLTIDAGTSDELDVDSVAKGALLRSGSRVTALKSGGGGYGDPLERDPAAVLDDVLDDIYTADFAERAFCVVIDHATMTVDEDATSRARSESVM